MTARKILHVLHNYPPEFRGGVERSVENAARSQLKLGLDVRVVAGSETVLSDAERRDEKHEGVVVHRLYRGAGMRDPVDPFRADVAALYESVLDDFRPDVVHVHHWTNLGDDLVRRAVRRGARVVVTLHDFFTTCALYFRMPDGRTPCDLPQLPAYCGPCVSGTLGIGEPEQVKIRVENRRLAFEEELRAASVVTAPSRAHMANLAPLLPPDVSFEELPLGSEPLVPLPHTPRTGPLRVLHFGNLCRLKGVELLADAVEAADPGGSGIRLRLLGGVLEPDLRTGRGERLGGYSPEALRIEAADADVAVFPSYARETYSFAVDEALRLGLPVLVSDRGAMPERVGTRGKALPAGDVAAFAAELSRHMSDPGVAAAMRRGAHAPLATRDEFGVRAAEIYARAAAMPQKTVSLEALHLRRLVQFERTFGHVYAELIRLNGLVAASAAAAPVVSPESDAPSAAGDRA